MTILLWGGSGQLGKDIQRVLADQHHVIAISRSECDISDSAQVLSTTEKHRPDAIVNCAAMTDVPGCELHTEEAFTVNALAARHIADASRAVNAYLIHISTDYVFDGNKKTPYIESDLTAPVNTYGITKLAGDHFVNAYHPAAAVVRTSGLYGIFECCGKKTNFVETMLRLGRERAIVKVVDDEVLTPTYTRDLAGQIALMLNGKPAGIFHATNAGACSWYDFTQTIFSIAGYTTRLERTTVAAFGSPVRRPAYSVLENAALQKLGIDRMRPWQDALRAYMAERSDK